MILEDMGKASLESSCSPFLCEPRKGGFEAKTRKDQQKRLSFFFFFFFLSQMVSYLTLMWRELFKALVIFHIVVCEKNVNLHTQKTWRNISTPHWAQPLCKPGWGAFIRNGILKKNTGEKCGLVLTHRSCTRLLLPIPTSDTTRWHDSTWDNAMNIGHYLHTISHILSTAILLCIGPPTSTSLSLM